MAVSKWIALLVLHLGPLGQAVGTTLLYNSSSVSSPLTSTAHGRFVRLGPPLDARPISVLHVAPLLSQVPVVARRKQKTDLMSPQAWVSEIDQILGIQRKVPRSDGKAGAITRDSPQLAVQIADFHSVVDQMLHIHRGDSRRVAITGPSSTSRPQPSATVRDSHAAVDHMLEIQRKASRRDRNDDTVSRGRLQTPSLVANAAVGSRPDPQSVGFGANLARKGLRVERGPHWQWGDQDGGHGSVGVVTGEIGHGWCTVQWSSGYTNGYRAGSGGFYDLRIARSARHSSIQAEPHRIPKPSPLIQRIRPSAGTPVDSHHVWHGLQVQRGPDWRWGNQDGGSGSVGIVQGAERNGWVNVRWPSGSENGYRAGDGGKYDLEVAGRRHNVPSLHMSAASQELEIHRRSSARSAAGCAARARTRCWCIDQYGDVLHLP